MSNAVASCRTNGLERGFAVPRGLGKLLDHFFTSDHAEPVMGRAWSAAANLWEDENAFHVEVDFPGVKREEVELVVDKGVLRILGARTQPEGERKYLHRERGYGQVERLITLPDTVNADEIEATLTDGVLHVTLGKRAEHQPRKIAVK